MLVRTKVVQEFCTLGVVVVLVVVVLVVLVEVVLVVGAEETDVRQTAAVKP